MRGDVDYLPDILIALRKLEGKDHMVFVELWTDYSGRVELRPEGVTLTTFCDLKDLHTQLYDVTKFNRIECTVRSFDAYLEVSRG